MPDPNIVRDQQPPRAQVDTRKWTTKVNLSVVLAVIVVLVIGVSAAVYQLSKPHPAETDQGLPGTTERTE
jgi:hypothetical protein